ncbi:hypothetical protein DL96DRAFT_1682569 [Flagelloscypha sp. PMI_526]|nr:hypothetical protein DL96DRAFT_1682569 [Flagelloscypha sp. PMI_526]
MFQKADTVTFTFYQKSPDQSGEVRDQNGQVVYTLRDEGEDHSFSKYFKCYPFHIERAYNRTSLGTFKYDKDYTPANWGFVWGSDSPRIGEKETKKICPDLMNSDSVFVLPDGTKWEWDGYYLHHFLLFNYQMPTNTSVSPGTSAIFTSKYSSTTTSKFSTLEVSRYEVSRPWLLDYMIITCLYIDQALCAMLNKKEAEDLGNEIDNAADAISNLQQ